jgi:hypothetical protein
MEREEMELRVKLKREQEERKSGDDRQRWNPVFEGVISGGETRLCLVQMNTTASTVTKLAI